MPACPSPAAPQSTTLKTWAGKEENWDAAQQILVALAKANSGGLAAAIWARSTAALAVLTAWLPAMPALAL